MGGLSGSGGRSQAARHFGIELWSRECSAKTRHRIEILIPWIMGCVALTLVTEATS